MMKADDRKEFVRNVNITLLAYTKVFELCAAGYKLCHDIVYVVSSGPDSTFDQTGIKFDMSVRYFTSKLNKKEDSDFSVGMKNC